MIKQAASLVSLMWFVSLTGCGEERAAIIDEIIGTYRGELPPGPATLVVNANGTWEYFVEPADGQPKFHRVGDWTRRANGRGPQIRFDRFEFGFRKSERESDPPPAYGWSAYFARHGSAVWVCIDPDVGKTCLKKVD